MLGPHQDQLFTYYISPSRPLFHTLWFWAYNSANCASQAPLSSGFLLVSANGRHFRKTGEEKREKGNFFWFCSFLHLPSNNSRRLASAPASFGPSSTFLAWVIAFGFPPSLFLDIYLELDYMFQRTGAKSVPEGNSRYTKITAGFC